MAEPEKTEEQQKENAKKTDSDEKKSSGGLLFWAILAVVAIGCAGAGLGLGHLFAGSRSEPPAENETAQKQQPEQQDQTDELLTDKSADNSNSWYYANLDPIIANLDEPGVRRYVRMSIILEINSAVDQKKGAAFLDEKNPLVINYLTVYLSSLSVEEVRGDKNLKRVQSQIKDMLNEKLFPDAKPQIKSILFKEFSVQ